MNRSIIVAAVLVAALAVVHAEDPTGAMPGVIDLTPSNFATHVGKKAAFIEFYAPWCGHCKTLAPIWKALGAKIAADPKLSSRVTIGKVDADAHSALGQKFGVQGFPTIKWFPRGKPSAPEDYQGPRSEDQLFEFIQKKIAEDAGFARVDALTSLARKFEQEADEKARKTIAAEIEKEAGKVAADDKDNAALYVKYANKALEKGSDYISKEHARLSGILESGSMSGNKLEDFSRKVSVLSAFTEDEVEAAPLELDLAGGDDAEGDVDVYADVDEY